MLCRAASLRRALPVSWASRHLAALPALHTALPEAQNEEFVDHPKPEVQISTLPNGVRVATMEAFGNVASLGVFTNMGSRDEFDIPATPESPGECNRGATSLLQHMAFRSTNQRSSFRLTRECERMGGSIAASCSHEVSAFVGDVVRPGAPALLDLLSGALVDPAFHPWEVSAAAQAATAEFHALKAKPDALTIEHAHAAAYNSKTLGQSVYVPPAYLQGMDGEFLRAFLASNLSGTDMCVSGVNVDHNELVAQSSELFGALPANRAAPRAHAQYVGGDFNVEVESAETTVGLVFDGPSANDSKGLVEFCLLGALFGGGTSFSAGGPGKGMHTVLYKNVLNVYPQVLSANSYNAFYADGGLFGVFAKTNPREAGGLVTLLCKQLTSVATKVDDAAFVRAKNQLASQVMQNIEQRSVVVDDLARQLLATNKYTSPSEYLKMLDSMTPQDLAKAARKMLASPLTYVTHGDLRSVPQYTEVARQLR